MILGLIMVLGICIGQSLNKPTPVETPKVEQVKTAEASQVQQ